MEEIGPRRRAIRSAIWLWVLLATHAQQSDAEWWPVCDGVELSDERVAVFLDVSAARAKKWRLRLEGLKMIRTEFTRARSYRVWIMNVDRIDAQKTAQPIPSPLVN